MPQFNAVVIITVLHLHVHICEILLIESGPARACWESLHFGFHRQRRWTSSSDKIFDYIVGFCFSVILLLGYSVVLPR